MNNVLDVTPDYIVKENTSVFGISMLTATADELLFEYIDADTDTVFYSFSLHDPTQNTQVLHG